MVVHIHAFGVYSPTDQVHQLCKEFGAFLYEDGAVWLPPSVQYPIRPNSCLGLSFGIAKPIDLGGGAWLISQDRSLLLECNRLLRGLPELNRDESGLIA